jgi:hypothetical protein
VTRRSSGRRDGWPRTEVAIATPPRLLIGTSTSGRDGDIGRREARAEASLAALSGADAVNLRFVDDPAATGPAEALPALRRDALQVSGRQGPRKPIVSEMLDVLSAEAGRRGCSRIALVNGDIIVSQAAVDRIATLARPAIALSRQDVGGGEPDAMLLRGIDMFVFDVSFWRAERRRFRPYILGEALWDNVYAAIAVCHGGTLVNREALITHERHPSAAASPFAQYGHLLATRDGTYFSRWCVYVDRAERLRAAGGTIEEEDALQRAIFTRPGAAMLAMDAVRAAWWGGRHRLGFG